MDDLRYDEVIRTLKAIDVKLTNMTVGFGSVLTIVKHVETKMDAVVTAVKEVPYLTKKISDLETAAADLMRVVLQGKTVAAPPPTEPAPYFTLKAEPVSADDEEDCDDGEDVFFAGILSKPDALQPRVGYWAEHSSDAAQFASDAEATKFFEMMFQGGYSGLDKNIRWQVSIEKRFPLTAGKKPYPHRINKPVSQIIFVMEKQS